MAYEEFADKPNVASGDALDPTTQINSPAQGLQDEFELRAGDALLDGVASGMVCSINGTNVAVAPGRAYVAGKRYSGSASVSFAGRAGGTYQVYIDSTDDTTPYQAKTGAPSSGELLLCTVSWSGSALSSLNDNVKVLGVLPYDIIVALPGTVATGVKAVVPVAHDLWIDGVQICLRDNGGTSGSTTVDAHLGGNGAKGDSIFTTQANRPTLAHDAADYTIGASGEPDGDRNPDSGEHLVIEVDEVAGTAGADLTAVIKARLR